MRHTLPFAVLAAVVASPAAALDLPARKPGLWELKMSFEGRNLPATTMQQCIDAATDKLMNSIGGNLGQERCSKQDVRKSGNTIVVDSVCNAGGATVTSHGVVTGDFNSAYTVKVTSKTEGGKDKDGTSNMTIEAKYTGACKADQKPGDIVMAGGRKINIVDMQKLLSGIKGMTGKQ